MDDALIEQVARAICANLGLDPDTMVMAGFLDDMTPREIEDYGGSRGDICVPDMAYSYERWRMWRGRAAIAIATADALK